jgi:hypothetical protein
LQGLRAFKRTPQEPVVSISGPYSDGYAIQATEGWPVTPPNRIAELRATLELLKKSAIITPNYFKLHRELMELLKKEKK